MSSSKPSLNTAELRQIFNKFDKNGDGKISPSELTAVMKSMTPAASSTTPESIAMAMSEIDVDKNGSISFEEFTAFFYSGGGDEEEEDGDLRDAFELYDEDGNGVISAKELHAVMKRLEMGCSVEECERMIKSVDEDGDGFVSFEEFKVMMKGGCGGGANNVKEAKSEQDK